jgi:hypothetical protein
LDMFWRSAIQFAVKMVFIKPKGPGGGMRPAVLSWYNYALVLVEDCR